MTQTSSRVLFDGTVKKIVVQAPEFVSRVRLTFHGNPPEGYDGPWRVKIVAARTIKGRKRIEAHCTPEPNGESTELVFLIKEWKDFINQPACHEFHARYEFNGLVYQDSIRRGDCMDICTSWICLVAVARQITEHITGSNHYYDRVKGRRESVPFSKEVVYN